MLLTLALVVAPAALPQSAVSSRRVGPMTDVAPPGRILFSTAGAPRLPDAPNLFGGEVVAGDIDLDGDQDLVIATSQGPVVWANVRGIAFVDQTASTIPAGVGAVSGVRLVDLDADGALDLVTTGTTASRVDRVLWNDGAGAFGGAVDLPAASAFTSSFAFADYDEDGDLDVVRSVGVNGHLNEAGPDSLLLNDGARGFTSLASFELAPWNDASVPTTSVLAFDADRDGHQDLLFCRADSGSFTGSYGAQNSLVLGAGDGTFVETTGTLPAVDDNSYGAIAADLDADGDLDVVVANTVVGLGASNSADVLINQGGAQAGTAGVFLERQDAIEERPSPSEALRLGITAGDVDLNGSIDVVFMVHDLPPGGDQPLYLGVPGSPRFERDRTFRTGTFIAGGAVLFDADGDSDLDLLITASGSAAGGSNAGAARLYMNRVR